MWFTTTSGTYGFSIESINASAFTTLQLSYGYLKNSNSAHANFSVDYWNGSAWVTVENTSAGLFNETATTTGGWFLAKTLNLPTGAQIDGLKLRFVKTTGTLGIRIDDIKLTGTPAGGDVTAPIVDTLFPLNGELTAGVGSSAIASFSEAVQAGTGTILLTKTVGGATVPATVTVTGSSLTIAPTAELEYSTGYTVVIPPGSIKDLANNDFGGIPETRTWAFTTIAPDITGPTMVPLTPANGATGITPPSTLSATFNEPVQLPNTSGVATITVRNSGGTPVATFDAWVFGTGLAVSDTVLTITLPPETIIDYGSSYYVELSSGAVEDLSGNPFLGYSGNAIWSFTTATVPTLTTGPGYTQNFSTFTSATSLPQASTLFPLGWSATGTGLDLTYDGDFGTGTTGGFRGNASVFAYQHTGTTGFVTQTLTLRNDSGAPITDLTVSYKGRVSRITETRIPIYAVSVGGTVVPGLAYSTADGDNQTRTVTVSGLNIANLATFQIQWTSDRGLSINNSRQIGISEVGVTIGAQQLAPTLSNSVPLASVNHSSATFNGAVISDGGSAITQRGFVYALTSANPEPTIAGNGVTTITDVLLDGESFSAEATGLSASTAYSVRAYAINGIGTSYGTTVNFSTIAAPPTFAGTYTQPFDAFSGTLPAGWTAISSTGAQAYGGAWGSAGASAGFTGGSSNPGVLGYQHTSGTGTLTTTLTLLNGTGAPLTELYLSYLGRASRTTEGRSPVFVVSVNGVEVPALAYSTLANVDVTTTTTLSGLNIAAGAPFTITWVSDRGLGANSSKQIGLGEVMVALTAPPLNSFASWMTDYPAVGGLTGVNDDYDKDGLVNMVENILGGDPSVSGTGLSFVSGTASSVTLRHSRSLYPASDLTASYEWSANLGTWYPEGAGGGLTVSITDPVVTTPGTPNEVVEVTASVTSGTATKLFVRLKVTNP